jgi:parallel beta-helix repeat protein
MLVLLAAFALVALVPVKSPPAPVGCGTTIITDTTLSANIGPCSGNGLVIGHNGITLNCAGHTISGTNTDSSVGIGLDKITRATVKDCDVTGFYFGIFLNDSSFNILSWNAANNNSEAGFYLWSASNNNTLSGNTANRNLGNGFELETFSNNNTLSGNKAKNNYFGFALSYSENNTLSGNTANANTQYGYFDSTTGSGTRGTSNIYSGNECSLNGWGGSVPSGLGSPQL